MQVTLSSKGYDVIASGMTYLFANDADITMNIIDDDGRSLSLSIQFKEDSSGKSHIEVNRIDLTLVLTCYNFEKSGSGLSQPVKIVEIEGKPLYFMFWSYLDGDEKGKQPVRSVRYTLFY